MRFYLIILICLVIIGCGTKHDTFSNNFITESDTLIPLDCIPKSFKTSLGTSILYEKVENEVSLSWGDKTYTRTHDEYFTCYDDRNIGRWDFIPKFKSETKNYLIFTNVLSTSSGGNPAPIEYYAILLPKRLNDSIVNKEMYLNHKDDYIIYLPGTTADSIAVLNIETNKEQIFKLNPAPLPFAKSPTFIIQMTKIKNHNLNVEYDGLNSLDSVVVYKNRFKLDI